MAEHTPGPWTWHRLGENEDPRGMAFGVSSPTEGPKRDDIARGYYKPIWEECEANARLIAAAPDLLAALKDIAGERFTPQAGYNAYNLDGMLTEAQELARAAIGKAES